jgi:hypothetical protein
MRAMIFLSHADQMSCKRSGSIYVGQGREQDAEPLSNGHVRYELKTPYRDGTTHVIFESMDCAPGKSRAYFAGESPALEGEASTTE